MTVVPAFGSAMFSLPIALRTVWDFFNNVKASFGNTVTTVSATELNVDRISQIFKEIYVMYVPRLEDFILRLYFIKLFIVVRYDFKQSIFFESDFHEDTISEWG
jgi:hypothetical protein